jgi:hypothetical protein
MCPIENKATNTFQHRLNMDTGFKKIVIIRQGMA